MSREVVTLQTCDSCGETAQRTGDVNGWPEGWHRVIDDGGLTEADRDTWELCPRCWARVDAALRAREASKAIKAAARKVRS